MQSRLGLSIVRRSFGSVWATLSADPLIPLTSSPYRHRWGVALLASCAFASATLPSLGVWLDLSSRIAFCGLLAAVMLTSGMRRASTLAAEGAVVPASFVLDFVVLLLFGPNAAMTTAATGLLVERLASPRGTDWVPRLAVNGAAATFGIQLAGFAYQLCGGAAGELSWPWQAAPIGVAALTYCVARGVAIRVLAPALTRQPIDRSWLQDVIASGPSYIVGCSIAAALAELIANQAWDLLAVAAVPVVTSGLDVRRLRRACGRRTPPEARRRVSRRRHGGPRSRGTRDTVERCARAPAGVPAGTGARMLPCRRRSLPQRDRTPARHRRHPGDGRRSNADTQSAGADACTRDAGQDSSLSVGCDAALARFD